MTKLMCVYGTRPEAIKVAPVIHALKDHPTIQTTLVFTGQHREMVTPLNELFGLVPDVDMSVLEPGQTLPALFGKVMAGIDELLTTHTPEILLVQGDTTTAAAAAVATYYRKVSLVHLEAGLRSGDFSLPFPEEANRKLIAQVARLHLAPTERNRNNLINEGVDPSHIVVTGNTVIDALQWARHRAAPAAHPSRTMLVTLHRRENWGPVMRGVLEAIACIAKDNPDLNVLFPMHRNPAIRADARSILGALPNVTLTEPLGYQQFVVALGSSFLVLTDSGGVQEEAPSLGVPVLVARDSTERPEGVIAGTVKLVGTEPERIVTTVQELLDAPEEYAKMAQAANPYGDGRAADRAVAAIEALIGAGQRMEDFRFSTTITR